MLRSGTSPDLRSTISAGQKLRWERQSVSRNAHLPRAQLRADTMMHVRIWHFADKPTAPGFVTNWTVISTDRRNTLS